MCSTALVGLKNDKSAATVRLTAPEIKTASKIQKSVELMLNLYGNEQGKWHFSL